MCAGVGRPCSSHAPTRRTPVRGSPQCVILTRRQSGERQKLWRPITFFALLALSFFARVIWFFLRAAGSNNFGDHIVNRIALLAFFGYVCPRREAVWVWV